MKLEALYPKLSKYDFVKTRDSLSYSLNESPLYDPTGTIDSDYLDAKILNHIIQGKDLIKKLDENVYALPIDKYAKIYFYTKNEDFKNIIVGVSGEINDEIDGKQMFIAWDTKKYDSTFSNAALMLYSWISRNTKSKYIVSGNIHSKSAMTVWQKWLTNPKKYNIKEIYIYNIQDNIRVDPKEKIEKYWGTKWNHMIHRIIVRF